MPLLILATLTLWMIGAGPTEGADAPVATNTLSLFDRTTFGGWKITEFAGKGEIRIEDGELRLAAGEMLTGLTWTNPLPARMNYEITLEAKKIDGSDFFCGLTFPYNNECCTWIVGGWGGGVVGLSSLDGQNASENDTTKYRNFEKNKWFKLRLRVETDNITAWVDDEKLIDCDTTGRKVSMRIGEIELNKPLGISAWQTAAALRNIRFTRLPAPAKTPVATPGKP